MACTEWKKMYLFLLHTRSLALSFKFFPRPVFFLPVSSARALSVFIFCLLLALFSPAPETETLSVCASCLSFCLIYCISLFEFSLPEFRNCCLCDSNLSLWFFFYARSLSFSLSLFLSLALSLSLSLSLSQALSPSFYLSLCVCVSCFLNLLSHILCFAFKFVLFLFFYFFYKALS